MTGVILKFHNGMERQDFLFFSISFSGVRGKARSYSTMNLHLHSLDDNCVLSSLQFESQITWYRFH